MIGKTPVTLGDSEIAPSENIRWKHGLTSSCVSVTEASGFDCLVLPEELGGGEEDEPNVVIVSSDHGDLRRLEPREIWVKFKMKLEFHQLVLHPVPGAARNVGAVFRIETRMRQFSIIIIGAQQERRMKRSSGTTGNN